MAAALSQQKLTQTCTYISVHKPTENFKREEKGKTTKEKILFSKHVKQNHKNINILCFLHFFQCYQMN